MTTKVPPSMMDLSDGIPLAAYTPSASKAASVLIEVLTSGGVPYKSGTLNVSLSNGET